MVFTGRAASCKAPGRSTQYQHVGLSGHGFTNDRPCDRPSSAHLGRRIRFEDLPSGLRNTVLEDYREIWRLNAEEDSVPLVTIHDPRYPAMPHYANLP